MTESIVKRQERVKQELIAAGMTKRGLTNTSSQYLYNVIHDDEHVKGVAYSIYGGRGPILVATEHRIIYLQHRASYTTCDDLSYDFLTDVTLGFSGPLGSLSLRCRGQDYTVGYVNRRAAQVFVDYVESKNLGYAYGAQEESIDAEPIKAASRKFPPAAVDFLKSHDVGVVSTVDGTGNVHGATVYYSYNANNELYILTRSETTKARNILSHQQVAFTISDVSSANTLQIQGLAEVVRDEQLKSVVFTQMTKPRNYIKGKQLPPVTSLQQGVYVIIRIIPNEVNFRRYLADN